MFTPKRNATLSVETLESREVLSTANIANGVLQVIGDDWENSIKITESTTQIHVRIESVPSNGFVLTPDVVQKTFTKSSVNEIKVWGYDGDDFVDNYVTSKMMTAFGGNGNDVLEGGNGQDNLYGGSDDDILKGYGGNDGLYGGAGTDALYGGSGSDRFLQMEGQTEAKNVEVADAVVYFRNGGKTWGQGEIQLVDGGLRLLHQRTGNDNLLETATGGNMIFIRGATSGNTLAFNSNNGTITFLDSGLTTANVVMTTIHEVGHNWDAEQGSTGWNKWLAQSGWSTSYSAGKVLSGDGKWYYNPNSPFALNYGKTNPREDWSTAWERYFTLKYNLVDTQNLQPTGTKYNVLDAFFNGLM